MDQPESYDLLLVADATGSMSSYLTSLQTSLPKIISISSLTSCFSRIGLLAYRDYCDGDDLLVWSDWLGTATQSQQPGAEDEKKTASPDLMARAMSLFPRGGGDYPEALKTGLAKAYEVMRPDATTIVVLYTDAPPHLHVNAGRTRDPTSNPNREKKALLDPKAFGGFGSLFVDWVSACQTLHSGTKRAQVFCVLAPSMLAQYAGHYNYLSAITRGACFSLSDSKPLTISQVTLDVLLAWMGVEKSGAATGMDQLPATMSRYIDVDGIDKIKDEEDRKADKFFASLSADKDAARRIGSNITEKQITHDLLKQHLPKKKTPMQDFAKRYATDEDYKKTVVEQLTKLIADDVSAISLNPIFGSLWRAVCNDRQNEARDSLIAAFGLQVDRISHADEKARMKAWLAESYDYTAEVLELIDSVPQPLRYPCVFLDPTLAFSRETGADGKEVEAEDDRPITSFSRDELLEIGRSCDYKILQRLGRVLTCLTFVKIADELPSHIANATDDEVPKIPMALASKEYGRKFWGILLHLVVPGTKLSARPAALLAALSIRMGVQPLLEIAEKEIMWFRKRWNDIEVPETWNVNCLSLLLDADQACQKRLSGQVTNGEMPHESIFVLTEADRALFERLVSYKMLELNLKTNLTAKVGWTPEKTSLPIGPLAICCKCEYPRSVTIMKNGRICGHCAWTDWKSEQERVDWVNHRVSKEDTEKVAATWVECNVRTCRAQYVVYHTEALNVRPKCHYCRQQGSLPENSRQASPAPYLECTQCLNRVIWPPEYRPEGLRESEFKCVACSNGRSTIIDVETTATVLSAENTTDWLIYVKDDKIAVPFNGRSLYYTISTAGTEGFCDKVTLFPINRDSIFTIRGKRVRNTLDSDLLASENQSVISQLQSWVSRRRTERGTCDLCFTARRKNDIQPACGRRGCRQQVCTDCLKGWYGLNAAGRLINIAALHCPFCRRAPTAKTLAGYGMGVHAVGNLSNAVSESGSWIYAWCRTCGVAKQYMERVCARGAPPELNGWACDECLTPEQGEGRQRIRNCPGCEVPTQKTGGCDHIECPHCGAHWCFFCGGAFSEDEIYPHMAKEHGGYYDGEDVYGYESEDEYGEE